MRSVFLPGFFCFSLFLAGSPAEAASVDVRPGTYALNVKVTKGSDKGLRLRGTVEVDRNKNVKASVKIPGYGREVRRGLLTKSGVFKLRSKSLPTITVTVLRAGRTDAEGRFKLDGASGTWKITRR